MNLDFTALRETRANEPEKVLATLAGRERRSLDTEDGRLFIVAADHPARNALGVRGDALAMADRLDLLQRLATALADPRVDGVLGTPDILEDLALLGLLDGKLTVGSMNRGGLRGASFEMDDRFTGYDVPGMTAAGLDMAKLLVRIDLQDAATVATLEATANAVTASAAAKLPIMVEPFMSTRRDGKITNLLDAANVIHSISVASALGNTSAYTWLKLPVVEDMERVMASTTLPTLLLGGDPEGSPEETYSSWERALAVPGVRGLVVGRTLLYPADGDVAGAVGIAAGLVHGNRDA